MFGIPTATIVATLMILGVSVVILLIIRELVCWYFKINEHIQDQWQQLAVMKKILVILEQQEARATTVNLGELVPQLPPKSQPPARTKEWETYQVPGRPWESFDVCPRCDKNNAPGATVCAFCGEAKPAAPTVSE